MEYERIALLDIAEDKLRLLNPLLESGVGLQSRNGVSLGEFLILDAGLDPGFAAERVQTVFCDCRPVDDVETARVHDGCVVALSAAMPGLVGAVMRKAGPLSKLRESISQQKEVEACDNEARPVVVWLKIFNLLRQELAAHLFRRGVLLPMTRAAEVLRELPPEFWEGSKGISVRGRRLDPTTHELGFPQSDDLVLLEVRAPEDAGEEEGNA